MVWWRSNKTKIFKLLMRKETLHILRVRVDQQQQANRAYQFVISICNLLIDIKVLREIKGERGDSIHQHHYAENRFDCNWINSKMCARSFDFGCGAVRWGWVKKVSSIICENGAAVCVSVVWTPYTIIE